MSVSLRGFTQGIFTAIGSVSVAHPSGTAVGDMGVVFCETGSDKKPKIVLPSGWTCFGTTSDGVSGWSKILTASDIASPLTVACRTVKYQVLTGAAGTGRVGRGESLTVGTDGGAYLMAGWAYTTDTLTTSAKIHPTDIVNSSYVDKKKGVRSSNVWFDPMVAKGVAYIDTNCTSFLGVEIVPLVQPGAPILDAPTSGAFLDAGPVSVTVRATTVNPRRLLIRARAVGSSTWNYLQGTLTGIPPAWVYSWSTGSGGIAVTWDDTSRWSGALPSASWLVAPADVEWQAAVSNSTHQLTFGPWSPVSSFSVRTKPTTTVSVSGSGLAYTVSWSATITNGSQQWYRVRVCLASASSPDVPVWDSGVVAAGDTSLALPPDLGWVNGSSYKAWVEVGQTGGQQTVPTASSAFTVSWTPPASPSALAVQAGPPLRVSANGVVSGCRVRLTFTANGVTYTAIQTAAATSVSFDVPLAPYGTPVTYSVDQEQVVSGVGLWSAPVTTVGTSWDRSAYLVVPDLSGWLQVHLDSDTDRADTEGVQVSYGLGASRPTVLRTPSQGLTGKTTLAVQTQADKQTLLDWLAANPSFILRWPPERDGSVYADVPATSMARITPRGEDRYVQRDVQARKVELSWVEQ